MQKGAHLHSDSSVIHTSNYAQICSQLSEEHNPLLNGGFIIICIIRVMSRDGDMGDGEVWEEGDLLMRLRVHRGPPMWKEGLNKNPQIHHPVLYTANP